MRREVPHGAGRTVSLGCSDSEAVGCRYDAREAIHLVTECWKLSPASDSRMGVLGT